MELPWIYISDENLSDIGERRWIAVRMINPATDARYEAVFVASHLGDNNWMIQKPLNGDVIGCGILRAYAYADWWPTAPQTPNPGAVPGID